MRWASEDGVYSASISADLIARVWYWAPNAWVSEVVSNDGGGIIWATPSSATEQAAKDAVCHWIGKTMAQFSNALAAGCNDVDDGN